MNEKESDYYKLTMPSGHRIELKIETPISDEEKTWLHLLVDLIASASQYKPPPQKE